VEKEVPFMVYKGKIKGGMVVMDDAIDLPEGLEVEIHIPDPRYAGPTLYERLESVIGIAEGLPSDLAENHDRYIHGQSKW
jgi:hypothetical protein